MLELSWSLPESISDPATGQVVRRKFHQDAVPGEDTNKVHPDLSGRMGEHPVPICQFYTKHGVGQVLFYYTLYFYSFFLSH